MHLANIKLWNFRKYGSSLEYQEKIDLPDLNLTFNCGLNVLIGSNDSGKTGIIDAIKLVLKTHSYENIRPNREDFFGDTKRFRIEMIFKDNLENPSTEINEEKKYMIIKISRLPYIPYNVFLGFCKIVYNLLHHPYHEYIYYE